MYTSYGDANKLSRLENADGTSTFQVPDGSDNSESDDDDSSDDEDIADIKGNTLSSFPAPTAPQVPISVSQYSAQVPPSAMENPDSSVHRATIDLTQAADESDSDIELGENKSCPIDLSSPPRQSSPIRKTDHDETRLQIEEDDHGKSAEVLSSRESSVDSMPEDKENYVSQMPGHAASLFGLPFPPPQVVTTIGRDNGPSEDDGDSIRLSDSENEESSDDGSSADSGIYDACDVHGYRIESLSNDEHSEGSFDSELDEMEMEADCPSENDEDIYDESK
jgi:hypothetical protein